MSFDALKANSGLISGPDTNMVVMPSTQQAQAQAQAQARKDLIRMRQWDAASPNRKRAIAALDLLADPQRAQLIDGLDTLQYQIRNNTYFVSKNIGGTNSGRLFLTASVITVDDAASSGEQTNVNNARIPSNTFTVVTGLQITTGVGTQYSNTTFLTVGAAPAVANGYFDLLLAKKKIFEYNPFSDLAVTGANSPNGLEGMMMLDTPKVLIENDELQFNYYLPVNAATNQRLLVGLHVIEFTKI
jgi:hypothetical protein